MALWAGTQQQSPGMDGELRPMLLRSFACILILNGLSHAAASTRAGAAREASCAAPLPAFHGVAVAADGLQADLVDEKSVSLLQSRGCRTGHGEGTSAPTAPPIDADSQAKRLEQARPIGWVHVPKCGSSFMNFLAHLPGMCPGVPEELTLSTETLGVQQLVGFRNLVANGSCPGSFLTDGFHQAAGAPEYKGHGVIMLRQPEQRWLSAYNFAYLCWPFIDPPQDELDYARHFQGCAVRMLARENSNCPDGCGCCASQLAEPPTEEDMSLAIRQVQSGLLFVGIMEEWALSICLGHRIFGGRCLLSDFVDTRTNDPGDVDQNSTRGTDYRQTFEAARNKSKLTLLPKLKPHNTSVLRGFRDHYDGRLYAAAKRRFDRDLQRYNVSIESCQPCFREAGVTVTP